MLVLEVMSRHPVTVREGTPVKVALRLLADHRITVMPVVTAGGMVRGVRRRSRPAGVGSRAGDPERRRPRAPAR